MYQLRLLNGAQVYTVGPMVPRSLQQDRVTPKTGPDQCVCIHSGPYLEYSCRLGAPQLCGRRAAASPQVLCRTASIWCQTASPSSGGAFHRSCLTHAFIPSLPRKVPGPPVAARSLYNQNFPWRGAEGPKSGPTGLKISIVIGIGPESAEPGLSHMGF